MPSDRRLHPLSILFGLVRQTRTILGPGLLFLFLGSRSGGGWGGRWGGDWMGGDWQLWAMLLVIPYTFVAVARYISFRYRYEATEMVVRTGLFFRNERHIPYARIQNLDAVRNVFHRLLGVVDVRVETGGAGEPEATMSVLPLAAYEEMRRRVFEGKAGEAAAPAEAAESVAPASASGRTLLHLPLRELLLCGFIENRGVVLIATGFGLLWELGLADGLMDRFFDDQASGRAVIRDMTKALLGQGGFPVGRIALTLVAFLGLLLFIRLISMVGALVRLHGFRLTRSGEDLRTEYGLLTRVAATIPLPRIQTLTILEGPIHRLFGRASVRVETAGGGGGEGEEGSTKQREWLAPIIRRDELPAFLHEVLPEVDLAAVPWQALHPRAVRREFKSSMIVAVLVSLPFVVMLKGWVLALLAVFAAWAYLHARLYVAHARWGVTEGAVLFRSGWLWRNVSVARFAKIQSVAIHESPFDRRAAMARVRVDTAGAGSVSHRVDIPYLSRETARALHDLLAARAAQTAFKW
ncbi:MAG TPA: PH domain-containing protein [Thermoanaerobaculia bacterium]|nr:PH domain-containing protein [Thermoanaerobaculia bacterium]